MTARSKFWFSGVISFIITSTFMSLIMCAISTGVLRRNDLIPKSVIVGIGIGLVVWFLTFLLHLIMYATGKREFHFVNFGASGDGNGSMSNESISPERRKALYPPIPNYLLSNTPDGFMFGKKGNKYVRLPIQKNNIQHSLIIGAPGTGKSAGPLLSTLIANYMQEKPPLTIFALDIKPELANKSVNTVDNPYAKVVNPTDYNSVGWDIYYALNQYSTADEIMETLDYIARSLIVCHDEKNKFFTENAINIFKGLMFFARAYWGSNFMDSMHWVLKSDVSKIIKESLQMSQGQPWEIKVSSLLSAFSGKPDTAFNNTVMTMNENLGIFMTDIIAYQFGSNPKKASPYDLEQGISVFISIPEFALEQYNSLLRLMVNQTVKYFEKRGDRQSTSSSDGAVLMIIDEFPRLHQMEMVVQGLATLRSRGVSIVLACQNLSQLDDIYGVSGRKNIVELCQCNVILSAKDSETVSMFSSMAGEYDEITKSYSQSGGMFSTNGSSSVNTSRQKTPVLTVKDFASLNDRNKVIVFCNGMYYQMDKMFYYKDKKMNDYSENVKKINGV